MIFDITIPIAFGAGLVSFFAPCVLPLLPAYIGYVTGVSASEINNNGYSLYRKRLLVTSIMYILGFSLLFVAMGTAAASISILFKNYQTIIQQIGGFVILILGLEYSGIIKISSFAKERKLNLPVWMDNLGYLRSFFVGIVFATAWSPCVGVVLGSILTLVAISGTAVQGAFLLFVYSLGITLPFLIVSMTLGSAPIYVRKINKHINKIMKISGIILIILGLLLFTNTYRFLNSWIYQMAFEAGFSFNWYP